MTRARIAVLTLLCMTLAVTASPAAGARPINASPLQARTMPGVESAISQNIATAGVTPGVIWIGADTNGHLTVASIFFSVAGIALTAKSLDNRAMKLAQLALGAVPSLDEVQLSGVLPTNDGELDPGQLPVVYSRAFSRKEAAESAGGSNGLSRSGRVWYGMGSGQGQLISAEPRRWGSTQPGPSSTGLSAPPVTVTPVPLRPLQAQPKPLATQPLRIVFQGNPSHPTVGVTFDDGPFPIYTTLLLDTLERMKVKATFFLVGEQVQRYPYLAQAIVTAGHEVANHTFHHVRLTDLTEPVIADEIIRAQDVITEVTGQRPIYFRPPGGRFAIPVIRTASALGLTTVFWTANSGDYLHQGVVILEGKILSRVHRGGILLLHQGVGETTRILPSAFDVLRQRGLYLMTLTALLEGSPRR